MSGARAHALTLFCAAALSSMAGAARACELQPIGPAARTLTSEHYRLAFRTEPATLALGQPFAIELRVCPFVGAAPPERIAVDATMPEHRHGMNYTPSVVARGDGRYRAEGLMLHMPGRWELAFEIKAQGRSELITFDIRLP